MTSRYPIMLLALTLVCSTSARAQTPDAKALEFFENRIRPVLADHCYACHSVKGKQKGGLHLDSKAAMLKGGESGPALVPGKPGDSLILKALRHESDLKMPPQKKLPDSVLADFEAWITRGAPDPRDGQGTATVADINIEEGRKFWAFQPPKRYPPPNNRGWAKSEIDHFILAELANRGLKPVPSADKRTLIRRATFDLIGLPPSPEEVDAFLRDDTADAFAKVVDRLLSSPHYGERWGRYWLDVARYAEDKALAAAKASPHAFRYRDWVVQAFNQDMPYDQFLRLQLAGDLLPESGADRFVQLAGLGFQGLGQEYHRGSVPLQVMADELDDRIDTLTRGLLGLTVACARCHDHKYDPIPTRDYYSLAAAYQGANLTEIPLASREVVAQFKAWQEQTKQREGQARQWLLDRGKVLSHTAVGDLGRYFLAAWRIRVLRANKLSVDEQAIARQEKLQLYFLARCVKFLDDANAEKTAAVLKPWLMAAQKAEATSRPEGDMVAVPEELQRATDELQREGQAVLQLLERSDPQEPGKPAKPALPAPQQAMLKTLCQDANAPFLVVEKDIASLLAPADQKEHAARQAELARHKQTAPPAPAMAHGVSGGGQAMRVYVRGNVERPGEAAPPGFLRVLRSADTPAASKFTRLELAEGIASPHNPLTARVFVNRVWHYHFGCGIVGTPSNFGKLGDRPTHPELLDSLAVGFMENGWSVKWLHRAIMLSTTYQLGSAKVAENMTKDPENQFHWRMSPRRLDVEAWRDAWLMVAGRLDRTLGGPSVNLNDPKNVRRTVYAQISRSAPNPTLAMFDFPDANVSSDRRGLTTVPQQQLFVLNSGFTVETARAFAQRLAAAAADEKARIVLAYRLAYGREPTPAEHRLGQEFLRAAAGVNASDKLTPWEQYAQAILAANEFNWVD